MNLFQKRVVDDKWCVLCGHQLEDIWRVFFNCRYALLQCWDKMGLRNKLETVIDSTENLLNEVFEMLSDNGRNTSSIFGMVVLKIWKERNSMVWDNTYKTPTEAMFALATFLREWIQAKLAAS